MVDSKSLVPWREKSQAPATRDDFFDPFVTFRREVDRIFDSFLDGAGAWRPLGAGSQGLTPLLDIADTEKELVVKAELPGVSEKDVEVTLSGDTLTIKGEKKAETDQKGDNYS